MAQDDPTSDLRIKPGGMTGTLPTHLVGLRGSKPFGLSNIPSLADGFQNLLSLNGETAVPFLQHADALNVAGSLLLGGLVVGAGDTVDVAQQGQILGQQFFANRDTSFVPMASMFNNEGIIRPTTAAVYGAYLETFTKSGSGVTMVAASNVVTGIGGTTWTTDQLSGVYLPAANIALNKVIPGDVLQVSNGAGGFIYFRIIEVTSDTGLKVFPTPTAGNAAIGVNRDYLIFRTGYGGYGRGIPFNIGGSIYWYFAGSSHNGEGSGQAGHGVVQAIQFVNSYANHYMGPTTVNVLGVSTGFFPKADDIAFYKGFLLYGADTAVSWSIAGFPTGTPFSTTDFPAANITVVDATSKFVTFEYLGDQLLAIFEESIWLVSATGSIPEFAFYRLPETLSIIHPGRFEPCGISVNHGLVYGRPSCTGRGAAFYLSDRGVEQLSGGLADEASAPINNTIGHILLGAAEIPYFLSWSDDFDLLWINGQGQSGNNAVYNPATKDWSLLTVVPTATGLGVRGVTGGVPAFTRSNDTQRYFHFGYYETLQNAGVPGTNGGNTASAIVTPDFDYAGVAYLKAWKWRTNVIPLGMRYPDYSFGGFLFDVVCGNIANVSITWKLYGGSSPYQVENLRQSGTITPATATNQGTGPWGGQTQWMSSRVRLGQKIDDPFAYLEFTSLNWVQIAGLILFASNTQVVR